MLKYISRDDLTELYRLAMQRYGTNGPEDEYERVFWGDLKTMFDPLLDTYSVWNLPADIYMLTERRYPLSADVCQATLDKKLQRELATPEQTATGKEISNPLISDSLLKTIRLSMHLVATMKH
ncbi:hypothetical protein Tco_0348785 [Tanacetum coccineum]